MPYYLGHRAGFHVSGIYGECPGMVLMNLPSYGVAITKSDTGTTSDIFLAPGFNFDNIISPFLKKSFLLDANIFCYTIFHSSPNHFSYWFSDHSPTFTEKSKSAYSLPLQSNFCKNFEWFQYMEITYQIFWLLFSPLLMATFTPKSFQQPTHTTLKSTIWLSLVLPIKSLNYFQLFHFLGLLKSW